MLYAANAAVISMFGNDPKKLHDMMRKLNMNIQEIPAEVVVIKSKGKQIIISNPEVMLANMMGKDVYQITGVVSESATSNRNTS